MTVCGVCVVVLLSLSTGLKWYRCVGMCAVCCGVTFTINRIEVVKASGECIRAVLLTKTGAGVLGKLEGLAPGDSWCAYLEPFKPGKKKKVFKRLWRQRS